MIDLNDLEIRSAMKRVAEVKPGPVETSHAVAAVREMVMKRERHARRVLRWRMLMKVSISSGVAAAVLMVVGFLWMAHDAGRADAAEVFQKIVDANREYKGWIHGDEIYYGKATSSQPKGAAAPEKGEFYINTVDGTDFQLWQVGEVRHVRCHALARSEIVEYDSASGTVQIGNLDEENVKYINQHREPFPVTLADWLARFKKQAGHPPVKITQQAEGHLERWELVLFNDEAERIRAAAADCDFPMSVTLWVESESKRIVKMKEDGPESRLLVFTYDVPEVRDIYDLGVPRNAKVVDHRLAVDAKTLLDRLDGRVTKGFGDHVALLTSSDVGTDGQVIQRGFGYLYLDAVQGPKWLALQYRVAPPPRSRLPASAFVMPELPADWPKPNVKELLPRLLPAAPTQFFMMDGNQGRSGSYQIESQSYPDSGPIRDRPVSWGMFSLGGERIWPNRYRDGIVGTNVQVQIKQDPTRPGLLGLVIEHLASEENKSNRQEVIYWLDPKKEDIPVEMTSQAYASDQKTVTSKNQLTYLDYAQLANGQWYPTRWRETETRTSTPRGKPARTDVSVTEYNLQLVPGMELEQAWFVPPSERLSKKGP